MDDGVVTSDDDDYDDDGDGFLVHASIPHMATWFRLLFLACHAHASSQVLALKPQCCFVLMARVRLGYHAVL